ncbi:MAG TPA: glycosyltransferase family 4 protein [Verrucomicrobiae bacterium]|jgi:glycosyltransferase involved in cell wall biosynthesis
MTPLTVAWISDFPVEWLPDAPDSLLRLPRQHPAMWELVLLNELERSPKVRLHILLLRSGIERSFSFQRNGVTFHVLKYRGGTRALSFYWVDTLLIRRALKEIQPHLVHAWGNEKGAGLIASRLKYPFLLTIQGLFLWYREHVAMSSHDKISVVCEKLSLARAKHVTVESNFSIEFIRRRYPRLALHKIEHAPNWTFHRVQRQPVTEPIRFLNIATTCHRKGTDLLLMALNELVAELPFRLVMIGRPDDPFLAPLRQTLSSELWRRVEFKAKLEPPEVAAELGLAALFLFPTRADNSPNAVKEAVAAGVPVVASDVGGIPDYVVPGENGLLFKTGSLEEFAAAIRQACRNPLFRLGRVPPESLERSRAALSPTRMAEGFLEAYRSVAGGF